VLLLRKIRKLRWIPKPTVGARSKSGLQADALGDLGTIGNTLSVWLIDDDEGNLNLVVSACAATRDCLANFDFALLSLDLIGAEGFVLRTIPGETPAPDANGYHRDLVELSAQDVSQLAELIFTKAETRRIPEKMIGHLLQTAMANGRLEADKVKPWILEKFGV
jgi:hypothetical protein